MTASYGFVELELDGRSAQWLATALVVIGHHWPEARCHHTAVGILTVELGAAFVADEPAPSAPVRARVAPSGENGTRAAQAPPAAAATRKVRRHHSDADKAAGAALARSVGTAEACRRLDVVASVMRNWLALYPEPEAEPTAEPVAEPELAPVSDLARTAAFVDSGTRHPVDHDAVKAAAYQEDGF